MTRAAVLTTLLVVATGSAVSAGPYLGVGIGTNANLGGDRSQFTDDGGRSGRLMVGQKFGRFSIEGLGTRYGLLNQGEGYDGTSLGVAGKLNFPLGNNFEVFGRAGLQRTWLSPNRGQLASFDGNGYLVGGGFEYHLDLSMIGGGAIFVDYTRNSSGLTSDAGRQLNSTASMWTLGITLAI
jgi:hypothetical protein